MSAMLRLARLAVPVLLLAFACNNDGETSAGATTSTTAPMTTGTATTEPATTGTSTTSTSAPTTGAPTSGPETTGTATTDDTSGSSTTSMPAGCEGDAPRVRLVTTMGDMVVQLDAVNAPITVANFIHYVEADFYAGTVFHRVIDGFVIQGGGYTASGQQKPTDPPIQLEVSPALTHVDGAIAMARTMDPNSATSQFYICDGPQPGLDGNYAVFGVLTEGFDVLAAISGVPTDGNDAPIDDVIIMSAACE